LEEQAEAEAARQVAAAQRKRDAEAELTRLKALKEEREKQIAEEETALREHVERLGLSPDNTDADQISAEDAEAAALAMQLEKEENEGREEEKRAQLAATKATASGVDAAMSAKEREIALQTEEIQKLKAETEARAAEAKRLQEEAEAARAEAHRKEAEAEARLAEIERMAKMSPRRASKQSGQCSC